MANFSGSFISDTYQRVLQLDTTLQDGTGSLLQDLPVTASHAISASYAVSASVEIVKEVSSSNADTASLALSGDGHFSGSFTGSFIGTLTGTAATASYIEYTGVANKPTLLSSSAQIADDISGSFTSTSASFSTTITSNSSSAATDIAALVVDSASFSTRVTTQESFSSSLDDTFATEAELNAATSSLSSSLATDIASLVTDSGSFSTRITNLTAATSSYALELPYFSVQNNNSSLDINTSGDINYSDGVVVNLSASNNEVPINRGNLVLSSSGAISIVKDGIYEIDGIFSGNDNGVAATSFHFFIGVDDSEIMRSSISTPSTYFETVNVRALVSITSGSVIDFRGASSANEGFTIQKYSVIVKEV